MQCPKCHRFVRKRNFNLHKKGCHPTSKDLQHYEKSKSGKHFTDCGCLRCQRKKRKKGAD